MIALLAMAGSLYCDMKALTPAERAVHREATAKLLGAVLARRPHGDGYTFEIDGARFELSRASAWMALERKCCPFLRFQLDVPAGEGRFTMRIRGPKGTREFLDEELRGAGLKSGPGGIPYLRGHKP